MVVDGNQSVADVVCRSAQATALISPRWWPANAGHVLVIPNVHHENLYDLPPADGHAVHDLTREIAIAMRNIYQCDGISIRQHNEPAGNQTVWHLHVHVFPRYDGDNFYGNRPKPDAAPAPKRQTYALRLRQYFE
jgi:histidine triad (HIT) family protein